MSAVSRDIREALDTMVAYAEAARTAPREFSLVDLAYLEAAVATFGRAVRADKFAAPTRKRPAANRLSSLPVRRVRSSDEWDF